MKNLRRTLAWLSARLQLYTLLLRAVAWAGRLFQRTQRQRIEVKTLTHAEARAMRARERERHNRIQQWTANHVGRGFVDVPRRPIAAGYFWKLDQGALDGVGRRQWRIYREAVSW